MTDFHQITIVGCGLIGGSLALALRRAGFTGRITACGGTRGPQRAVECGIADELEESFARGEVCQADLVYLAAPIGGIIDFLRTRGGQVKAGALVTDAGSTKAEICRVARAALPAGVTFIGGHPMAGSEQTGIEYARADLFDRAVYALTAAVGTEQTQLDRLRALVEMIGARPLLAEPEEHDAAVALISHLPQLVASALAALLDGEPTDSAAKQELASRLAANGWRDMTRLGGSSWSVWRDICLTNQGNITVALGELMTGLQALKEALETRDYNRVRELFAAANRAVEQQRARHYHHFDKL
jgi:prephenate dehydrogenase